jgi:hypothetical protein
VGGQEDGHEDGQEEYTIDYISDAALARGERIYHVYWEPPSTQEADEADDTWEPASNLPGIDLKRFDGCFLFASRKCNCPDLIYQTIARVCLPYSLIARCD